MNIKIIAFLGTEGLRSKRIKKDVPHTVELKTAKYYWKTFTKMTFKCDFFQHSQYESQALWEKQSLTILFYWNKKWSSAWKNRNVRTEPLINLYYQSLNTANKQTTKLLKQLLSKTDLFKYLRNTLWLLQPLSSDKFPSYLKCE